MTLLNRSLAMLAIGFVVLLVTGGSRFAIGLTLRPMAEDFDWSRGTLSLAVLIYFVVSSVSLFLSGRITDRFGLVFVLAGGLAISAIGIGFISAVTQPWHAFVLYGVIFAIGNGLASLTPVGVMISRWFTGRIGLANAVAISGAGFGQLIMIGGLAMVMVRSGWPPVYFWLGIANLALVPLVLLAVRERAGDNSRPKSALPADLGPDVVFSKARRTPYFWRLTSLYVICGFQDFFVSTHVVAFAQDRGVETLFAGYLLALMGLAGLIGVILSGLWSDRSGPLSPTVACFILRIVLFGVVIFVQNTVVVAVFALLYGMTFWVTAPLAVVFSRRAFGMVHLGTISGFITMLHHFGGGLGAYTGGLLFDYSGDYRAAFAVMFVLSVAATILSIRLKEPDHVRAAA